MSLRIFILIFLLSGCQSSDKPSSSGNAIPSETQTVSLPLENKDTGKVNLVTASPETNLFDTTELKKVWNDCVLPIINLDKDKLKQVVHFPLAGDWGYMIGLKKPEQEWSEKDFFGNLDKLFYPEFIDKLKRQTYKNIDIQRQDNGEINLLVSVNYETIIEDLIDESSIMLRFKNKDGKWKLYVIFGAG